ncbi:RNA polymerase sigma factor [Eubacterium sp.]
MQSIEEIYKNHANMIFKYLMSLCGNQHIAEELTQETFYQAIKCINKFDKTCKITTWLCSIAKNQYLAYVRKHPPSEDIDLIDLQTASTEDKVIQNINNIQLLKLLHNCPEPYREIIYLRLWGNLSFREIGDIFSKSENWARVTFYRGKEKLRKEFSDNEK